ncbi:MAG: hypothetical protein JSV09_12610, partial [Thermoplasmata archaeon]
MKVRAIIFCLLLIVSILGALSNMDMNVGAQTILVNDTPSHEDIPFPTDYEFEVKAGNYSVIGVRPEIGDDFDLEINTDTSYTTPIDSSTTVGDAVDFVVLDKDAWNSPPNRGARITSGLGGYGIEMENEIDSHPVFDTWSGEMDKTLGNPVLDVGAPGSWDDTFAYFPSIFYDGSIYHMWYSGFDGSNVRIGYANSTDGLTWKKYTGNPVLHLGSPGSWEDFNVHYPMVLYNGTTYQMWYSGFDDWNYRIGYATSPDGLTWTKYGGNPVMDMGAIGSWEDTYVAQASVIYEGATYHMWYSGLDSFGEGRTGYATSSDGISWSKYAGNPVLDLGSPGSWDDNRAYTPNVIFDGSLYHMWYSGHD